MVRRDSGRLTSPPPFDTMLFAVLVAQLVAVKAGNAEVAAEVEQVDWIEIACDRDQERLLAAAIAKQTPHQSLSAFALMDPSPLSPAQVGETLTQCCDCRAVDCCRHWRA